jgi:hypothetical protein
MGGMLDDAWIAAHNARVRAFWAEYRPRLEALTLEECEMVARHVRVDHLSMLQLGTLLRTKGKLPFTWDADRDMTIGLRAYQRALEVLGLYDDDFRPRPRGRRRESKAAKEP